MTTITYNALCIEVGSHATNVLVRGLRDGGASIMLTHNGTGLARDLTREDVGTLHRWLGECLGTKPLIGSAYEIQKCRNLACGVIDYCAEWCPACGSGKNEEAPDA